VRIAVVSCEYYSVGGGGGGGGGSSLSEAYCPGGVVKNPPDGIIVLLLSLWVNNDASLLPRSLSHPSRNVTPTSFAKGLLKYLFHN
jgi:hypothetical protein